MLRKKSLLALLLSLCMVVGILPATVFAAGAGMPQNIRWAESPKSMVQWDAPSRRRPRIEMRRSFGLNARRQTDN